MQANLEIKKYLEENGITQIFISRKTGIDLWNSRLLERT